MRADAWMRSVSELLVLQAAVRGRQVAFSAPRREISYTDLERRTARIAGHLSSAGVAPGDRVAVYLGSGIEAVESTLAITRAAAIGVPLDPRSSAGELAHALDDSGARVVFTDSHRLRTLRTVADAGTVIVLVAPDRPDGCLWHEDLAQRAPPRPAADDLGLDAPAWMHYTSGTTGDRKGVLSSQRAWLWSARACSSALGLSSQDRLLWPLPLFRAFGHSMCVIGTLSLGATARLLSQETLLDSLHSRQPTVLAGVPTTYRALIAEARAAGRPLPRPRICLTGGAPVPSDLSIDVEELLGVSLLNRYGSTETCGAIAMIRPADPYLEGSCGRLLPGIDVRLVAPDVGTDVAHGQEGEIWVRGPSLMLGYHKDATSPFVDGWYRTGDLGRWIESHLAVTGRVKELIIRGGENIHPAEVERVLLSCPGVADAVVAGVPHEAFGQVPVAFVVPGRAGADPQVLLAACRAELPGFKVPAALYEIDQVPRTTSGKPGRLEVSRRTARPLLAPMLTKEAIEPLVLAETGGACRLPPGEPLDPGQPFATWGLTSLAGVVLRDRLATLTGLALPATLVFDHRPRRRSRGTWRACSCASPNLSRRRRPASRPVTRTRLPLSRWLAGTPAASAHPRTCGRSYPMASTSPRTSLTIEAGTSANSTTLIRTHLAPR
jgi:acyl-CoA synthetase (AMP-forming)/AMP-acid ligase II